jgi:hypothetical protein
MREVKIKVVDVRNPTHRVEKKLEEIDETEYGNVTSSEKESQRQLGSDTTLEDDEPLAGEEVEIERTEGEEVKVPETLSRTTSMDGGKGPDESIYLNDGTLKGVLGEIFDVWGSKDEKIDDEEETIENLQKKLDVLKAPVPLDTRASRDEDYRQKIIQFEKEVIEPTLTAWINSGQASESKDVKIDFFGQESKMTGGANGEFSIGSNDRATLGANLNFILTVLKEIYEQEGWDTEIQGNELVISQNINKSLQKKLDVLKAPFDVQQRQGEHKEQSSQEFITWLEQNVDTPLDELMARNALIDGKYYVVRLKAPKGNEMEQFQQKLSWGQIQRTIKDEYNLSDLTISPHDNGALSLFLYPR